MNVSHSLGRHRIEPTRLVWITLRLNTDIERVYFSFNATWGAVSEPKELEFDRVEELFDVIPPIDMELDIVDIGIVELGIDIGVDIIGDIPVDIGEDIDMLDIPVVGGSAF